MTRTEFNPAKLGVFVLGAVALAVLAIVLWPLVWLLSLPFRVVGITFDALFALLRAVLFLPARIFGYRGSSTGRLS